MIAFIAPRPPLAPSVCHVCGLALPEPRLLLVMRQDPATGAVGFGRCCSACADALDPRGPAEWARRCPPTTPTGQRGHIVRAGHHP